jgi:hypothetical protein
MSIIVLEISVKLDMKDLIVSDRDTDMASLMILVSVKAADIFERAVWKYIHFIDSTDTASETFPFIPY